MAFVAADATASSAFVTSEAALHGLYGLRVVLDSDGCIASDTSIIASRVVSTTEWFEGCAGILAEDVTVSGSGDAVLRAGLSIAIGDGFVVESGGQLTLELDDSLFGDAFLQKTLQDSLSRKLAVRFYFDLDQSNINGDDDFDIFSGVSQQGKRVFWLTLRHHQALAENRMFGQALKDDGTVASTVGSEVLLPAGSHYVDVVWTAASASGSADGSLRLWLDGAEQIGLGALQNSDYSVKSLRLGVVGLGADSRGHIDFDSFLSKRAGPIGAQ